MNTTPSFPLWGVLIASATMFMLIGCGEITSTVTPTALALPSSTPAPPYNHYTPSEAFNSHLEFDYPGYWYFDEGKVEYTNWYEIFLADPTVLLSVPTRASDELHDPPHEWMKISIEIRPVNPGQTLESLAEEQKRIDINATPITLLRVYSIKIDGYDAYVLETLDDYPEIYTSVMFRRRIFFIAYDQVYRLDFVVPKEKRGGEFEQGYEYFFHSLKIVP